MQRSDAETKKKGKDSPIPCPSPVLALFLTEGSLAAVFFFFFFLGNDAKFQGKRDSSFCRTPPGS